ncbi:hypothetical protein EAH79_04115 [Sphingomonas koreensis]|nr:hypothetical protein EAH79_04115 [Sphingomonas koreensis]
MTGLALVGLSACSKPDNSTAAATANVADTPASPTDSAMRIRGTAQTVSAASLTVQGYDGQPATVSLGDKTAYAWVVPSSLSTLKNGDFIGTATTGDGADMKALEVVIFPESMRGTGEGHYGWQMPAAVANADQPGADSASAMTNGTVQDGAMTNGSVQNGAMTNGTVQSGAGAAVPGGGTRLTIGYKGGTATVMVPDNAPIVRFEPTQKTMLAKGQKLFVVAAPGAGGTPAAQFVAMGKDGLMPPM